MADSSGAVLWNPESAGPATESQALPSVQLARVAELAAAEAAGAAGAEMLSERALADVLAAVDAVDLDQHEGRVPVGLGAVHTVGGRRQLPPAAGAPIGGGALHHSGGRGDDRGGEVAVHPGDVDPVGVFNKSVPYRCRPRRPGSVRSVAAGLSGIRRIRAMPPVRREVASSVIAFRLVVGEIR